MKPLPQKGTPEWHQLQIAKKTLKMAPAMVGVMGGMSIEEAKQILDEYGIKYDNGGSIPNNYQGKTAEQVWLEWDVDQRYHFLIDHENKLYETRSLGLASGKDYSDLNEDVKRELEKHISEGQYAKGGIVPAHQIPDDVYWALYEIDPRLTDVDLLVEKSNGSYNLTVGKAIKGTDARHLGFKINIEKSHEGTNERIVFDYLDRKKMAIGGTISTVNLGEPDITDNYYRFRLRSPEGVEQCRIPEWAVRIAESVKKGAKVTTCKKDEKWFVQNVMVPTSGVTVAEAKKYALQIIGKLKGVAMREGGNVENWEVKQSSVGTNKGWHFTNHINFSSALYKTKEETEEKLKQYFKTGKFDWYGSAEMAEGGSMAKGGGVADYTLIPNPEFKYQNIIKRWLEDNLAESVRYKLAVLLLSGEQNPDEKLSIEEKRYDRLLRHLDSISESKHEMSWRTLNYSTREAEDWARESLKEMFLLKSSGGSMAKGGRIGLDTKGDFVVVGTDDNSGKETKIGKYDMLGKAIDKAKQNLTKYDVVEVINSEDSMIYWSWDTENGERTHYESMAKGGLINKLNSLSMEELGELYITYGLDGKEEFKMGKEAVILTLVKNVSTKALENDLRDVKSSGGSMAKGGEVRSVAAYNKLVQEKENIVKNLSPKQVADMWNKEAGAVKGGVSEPVTEEWAKNDVAKMYLRNLLIEKELTEAEYNKYFATGGPIPSPIADLQTIQNILAAGRPYIFLSELQTPERYATNSATRYVVDDTYELLKLNLLDSKYYIYPVHEEMAKGGRIKNTYNEISYYAFVGGHGSIGNYPNIEKAVEKAMEFLREQIASGGIKDLGYIDVSGDGDDFAIIYITQKYLNMVNTNWFKDKKAEKEWRDAANTVLRTGVPVTSTYSGKKAMMAKGGEVQTIAGIKHDVIKENINHQNMEHIQLGDSRWGKHPMGDIYTDGKYGYVQSGYDWLKFKMSDLDKIKDVPKS